MHSVQLVKKAREDGEDEFEVDGKTYKVTEQSDSSEIGKKDNHVDVADCKDCDDLGEGKLTNEDVEESIAEFEVDGKNYKVGQNWSKITLAEKLDRILGNRKIL